MQSPLRPPPVATVVDQKAFVSAHASPAVRRFARELGVDLSKVQGSGRKDRVTKEDVLNAIEAKKNAIKEAGSNARAILDRATRDIDIERDKAILQLRNEITRLTLRASREVASKLVTPEVHSRLVKKYLEDLEGVRS